MQLKKLILHNFRQFYGTHEILFAVGNRNVTVVYGANGRGKTGLYRALIFGLYGSRKLTQDGDISDKEIILVNKFAIDESDTNGLKTTDGFVTIEFQHKLLDYILTRKLKALKIRDKIVEEIFETKLIIKQPDGNSKIIDDPDEVFKQINLILDARVKEYFLFDGERIEKITRADTEQRKAIANGIKDLLNIDTLTKAMEALGKLISTLRLELSKKCPEDYSRILKNLEENATQFENATNEREQVLTELEHANVEISKIDKLLDGYRDIRHLIEKRKDLQNDAIQKKDEVSNALNDIRKQLVSTGYLLSTFPIRSVFSELDIKVQKGEIPPELKTEFVDRLLQHMQCICGREVKIGSKEYDALLEWKKTVSDGEIRRDALKIWQHLSTVCSRLEDTETNLQTSMQRYAKERHDLRQIDAKIEEISDRIGHGEREDAAELENVRSKNIKRIDDLRLKDVKIASKLADLKTIEAQLLTQRAEKEKELKLTDLLTSRMKLAEQAQAALKTIFIEFTDEIKEMLSIRATDIFNKLIDAVSKQTLSKIIVEDDYTLQIVDNWGKHFLANISAGQRQIMSIAFITALAQEAAGGEKFEMPLFMDTPFGRLSNSHRKALINNLPQLCSQWILLATDTEYRNTEHNAFSEIDALGSFWLLKANPTGGTTIENIPETKIVAHLSKEIG